MSGWLHPAGPESSSTYWARRMLVIMVLVALLVVAATFVSGAARAADPETVPPATTPSVSTPAPSPAVTPGPGSSPSASGNVSASARPSASSSPSTSPSTSPSGSASARPTLAACDPSTLRTTLQGNSSPKVKQRVSFALSVINGGDARCTLRLDPSTVELKIYSGVDRIWSTRDCARRVPVRTVTLGSQRATAWKLTWDGRRSAAGCRSRPEVPRPGTYFATFQLKGADPVQQRMLLH